MEHHITSASNPRIKKLVELRKKARQREKTGSFIIEGTRLFMDTPKDHILEVYVTDRWMQNASGQERAQLQGHPFLLVTEEVMARAADTGTPQGVLCVAKMPSWTREDLLGISSRNPGGTREDLLGIGSRNDCRNRVPGEKAQGQTGSAEDPEAPQDPARCHPPLLLLLEDIQDPGNLGTMFRTAEAAGATGILMSRGTVDLFNPKVVRATMSAVFRMPFLVSDDLCADISALRKDGIRVYAAHLGGSRPYDSLPLTRGSAFLIGNEGNGLSEKTADTADEKIIIPMAGATESLNAAMAAGILLFEAARQRRSLPLSALP